MPPDSTIVTTSLSNLINLLNPIHLIVGILVGLITLMVLFGGQILPWWRAWRKSHSLKKHVGRSDLYPVGVIQHATRYYVEPLCQSVDPAGGEEPRLVYGAREKLFDAIDNALNHPTENRYLFLLADSGMGKTAFLLNYYARHLKRWRKKFELALLPLGIPDVDLRIEKIPDKANTVLFLDALDEDTLAIGNHTDRLYDLMKLTREITFDVSLPPLEQTKNYRISIFNLLGQRVKKFRLSSTLENHKKITWNGRDEADAQVSSGVYFAILQGPRVQKTVKLLLVQ